METLALYERVLARLPPAALRDSCNGELQSELADVHARLAEVTDVFGRLKEVETAVAQLEQDKGDRRRSASLMALVADTERVQRRLVKQIMRGESSFKATTVRSHFNTYCTAVESLTSPGKKPAAVKSELKPESTDSKRGPDAKSCSSDALASDWATQLAAKVHDQSDHKEKREPKSESVDKAQVPKPKVMQLERAQMLLQQLSSGSLSDKECCVSSVETARGLVFAIGRSKHSVVDSSELVQTAADALSRLSKRLRSIRFSIFDVNGVTKLSKALVGACAAQPALQPHFGRSHARLIKKLSEAKRDPVLLSRAHPCVRLALEVDALPLADRFERVGDVGALIESTFEAELHGHRLSKTMEFLNAAVKWVVPWVEEMTPEAKTPAALKAVRDFRDTVLRCANRIPGGKDVNCVASLRKMMAHVRTLIDEASDEASTTVSTPSKRARDESPSAVASSGVTEALDLVIALQDGVPSISQLDKAIKQVGELLGTDSALRSDPRVVKCVSKLAKCVEGIEKDGARAKRLATVNAWGVAQAPSGKFTGKKSASKGGNDSSSSSNNKKKKKRTN